MTADLAIIAMATVTALQVILDHRHRMKVADRERLVGPVKAQQPKGTAEAKAGDTTTPPALVPGMKEVA
jgi:hypothetical protein